MNNLNNLRNFSTKAQRVITKHYSSNKLYAVYCPSQCNASKKCYCKLKEVDSVKEALKLDHEITSLVVFNDYSIANKYLTAVNNYEDGFKDGDKKLEESSQIEFEDILNKEFIEDPNNQYYGVGGSIVYMEY